VQPYPGSGGRQQVSVDGGTAPAWARNGRELFYIAASGDTLKMMAVDVTTTGAFKAGVPHVLFEWQNIGTVIPVRGYDVTPDGLRFVMVQVNEQRSGPVPMQMTLVTNWFEELKRLVPTK
jgi:hypothetical protein